MRPNNTDSSPLSQFLPNNAPVQVLSNVPEDGVVLNSFMKVMQPVSGSAVSTHIWLDEEQKSYAHLPMVQIDLFNVQVTAPVTIDNNGVHFAYDAKLFDNINAHVTVNSISDGDWADINFNVSVDIRPNQDFVTDIQSSIKIQINNKVNLLSNRLSNLQSVQQILYSLITKQDAKANHSKVILDTLGSQYTELFDDIDTLETEYWTLKQSYEQTKGVNNVVYDNLRAVCDVEVCESECFSLPSLKVETDFDYIKEWRPVEDTAVVNVMTEVTGMTLDKQWMVSKQCWPTTLIKDWGKTAIGQECSYQSRNTESMHFKTKAEMDQRKVASYCSKIVNSYSYREDLTTVTSEECGMIANNTECLFGNAACVVMWNVIYNNSSDDTQKQSMKPLIDLVEVELRIATKKQKLSHLKLQSMFANTIYEQDLLTLEKLQNVHQSVFENLKPLQIQLTYFKSLVNANTFDYLNITSVTISSVIKNKPNNIVSFRLEFYLPTYEENITELLIDIALPLPVITDLLADVIFNKVSLQPYNSTSHPITSYRQFYKHRCSVIKSAKYFANQLFNLVFNQQHVNLNAIANLTALFYQHKGIQTDYNITNVNFEASKDLFSIESSEALLKEMIGNESISLTIKSYLLKMEKIVSDVLSNSNTQQFFVLLTSLDSIHIPEKIEFIDDEICFGVFDCLKQVDYEMYNLYKKTPIKSTVYSDYYDANHIFNSSNLMMDANTLATVMASMSDYWCSDPPVFTGLLDITLIMHIGNMLTLSCTENLQSSLPITGYKWRKNGYFMANENSDILIINSVARSDSGWYQCVVTNNVGFTSSPIWTLTVIEKPKIISEPVDTITFEGNDNGAMFSCNASVQIGTAYSWYYSKYGEGNWKIVANDSNELTIRDPIKDDEGWYRCHMASVNVNLVTDKAHLTVLHTSISELWLDVYFEIKVNDLNELDEHVNTTIKNQLASILKPEYAEIKVKNTSSFESFLIVELQIGTSFNYIPSMQLSAQANEAIKYKQDLINVVNEFKAKATSSQVVFTFKQNSFKPIDNSLIIGEMQYVCPPGKALQSNNFLCGKTQLDN